MSQKRVKNSNIRICFTKIHNWFPTCYCQHSNQRHLIKTSDTSGHLSAQKLPIAAHFSHHKCQSLLGPTKTAPGWALLLSWTCLMLLHPCSAPCCLRPPGRSPQTALHVLPLLPGPPSPRCLPGGPVLLKCQFLSEAFPDWPVLNWTAP